MPIHVTDRNQPLNSNESIRSALDQGFSARVSSQEVWVFPINGADGCVGKLCVSRYHPVEVAGAQHKLAVHVTLQMTQIFVATRNAINNNQGEIRFELKNLHFTARPVPTQLKIGEENAVAATPSGRVVSLHRGIVNDWQDITDEKAGDIGAALGMQCSANDIRAAVSAALQGFDSLLLQRIRDKIRDDLRAIAEDDALPREIRPRLNDQNVIVRLDNAPI